MKIILQILQQMLMKFADIDGMLEKFSKILGLLDEVLIKFFVNTY